MICGQVIRFKVFNGRINNTEYMAYHARQALPKIHRLFPHEYPRTKK